MGKDYWRNRISEGAVLSPIDRISEVLFGLIMVLTFTGAISVANERSDVRELLWAALGCNVAWGIVDAVMYLMNVMLERGHAVKIIKRIQESGDRAKARESLREEIQPLMSSLLTDAEADQFTERLKETFASGQGYAGWIGNFSPCIYLHTPGGLALRAR